MTCSTPRARLSPEERRRVKAERARRNAYDFARFVAPENYVWNWHHGLLYRYLDGFAKGTIKRLIVEMPPGHGKSEGCSRNLPAWLFGRWPDCRVIACSYTQDLAAEMNRDVQRVMDSDRYGEVFPGRRLGAENIRSLAGKPRRNSDVFDIPNARGFYKAAGVGVGIGGRRFDRGIIDDPVKDREEARSPTHRERVWRWFTSTFYTRQAKDAGICITSTRWDEDDLVGRIKRKVVAGEMEPWEVLTLPALATDVRHADDPRQPGEALWPWFRPAAELERIKTLEPRDFFALQQQDPRGEGATEWGPECFPSSIWFDDWPHPDSITLLVIALDPSKGKDAKHGDYSALVVLARARDGTLWVEADLARRPTPRIVADGIELARRVQAETGHTLDGFGVESDQFQELLADEFVRQTKDAGFTLPIFKMTTGGVNKEVRIRRLSSDVTKVNIRYRATPGTRLLVRQMEQFPNADHDDGPDALEYGKRLGVHLWNGRKR
jgi:predicted phage terminase large subunit-like protein